ncbi:hypothetical protein BDZ85DRAFT_362 [Elsinoe ampelina]|uniref:Rhodopsin domain-containing protein n=1 Tax=Elsinoe ampelina TaxID=302913 RepID=A0A6A6GNZ0_9PEZI|nr:hypothetical protein BDZ85DRAFT_362 [Elsinoe ampelina]
MPSLLYGRNADGASSDSPAAADDEATLGPQLLRVSITLAVLTFLVACHRIVFVWMRRGFLGVEEIILAVAVFFLVALTAVNGAAVDNGLGHYILSFPSIAGNVDVALKLYHVSLIIYQIAIPLKKLVFLTLYLRLFPYRRIPLLTKITIGVVSIISTVFFILIFTPCRPLSVLYTAQPPSPGTCISTTTISYVHTGYDLLTDIWILALPFPALQTLKSPLARTVSGSVLLCLAAFSCALIGARTASLASADNARKQGDYTHDPTQVLLWSHIEVSVGLICTCVPSLKQPLKSIWGVSMTMQRSVRSGISQVSSQVASVSREGVREKMVAREWEKEIGTMPRWREDRPMGLFSEAGSRVSLATIRSGRRSGETVRSKRKSKDKRKSADAKSVRSVGRRSGDAVRGADAKETCRVPPSPPWNTPAFPSPAVVGPATYASYGHTSSEESTPVIRSVQDSRERLLKPSYFSPITPTPAPVVHNQPVKGQEVRKSPSSPQLHSEKWAKHIIGQRRGSEDHPPRPLMTGNEQDLEKATDERRHTTDAVIDGSPYGDVAALSYAMSWGSGPGGDEGEEVQKMFRGL